MSIFQYSFLSDICMNEETKRPLRRTSELGQPFVTSNLQYDNINNDANFSVSVYLFAPKTHASLNDDRKTFGMT